MTNDERDPLRDALSQALTGLRDAFDRAASTSSLSDVARQFTEIWNAGQRRPTTRPDQPWQLRYRELVEAVTGEPLTYETDLDEVIARADEVRSWYEDAPSRTAVARLIGGVLGDYHAADRSLAARCDDAIVHVSSLRNDANDGRADRAVAEFHRTSCDRLRRDNRDLKLQLDAANNWRARHERALLVALDLESMPPDERPDLYAEVARVRHVAERSILEDPVPSALSQIAALLPRDWPLIVDRLIRQPSITEPLGWRTAVIATLSDEIDRWVLAAIDASTDDVSAVSVPDRWKEQLLDELGRDDEYAQTNSLQSRLVMLVGSWFDEAPND